MAGVGALALVLTPGVGFAAEDGGDTAPGNNLSMPVIWAEPDTTLRPVLRGTELVSVLEGVSVPSNDGTKTLFLQKDAKNTWQAQNDELAESGLADTVGKLPVSFVDWGDNLEVRDPGDGQQMIRVETRLMQTVAGMTGFSMQKVGEASGTDEMWGVVATQPDVWVGTQEQRVEAFAYTAHACLTLERIDVADDVVWDPASGTWTGAGTRKCIGEGADGPGSYGAEVTISGGMTYGFVWSKPTPGLYRLTFSLEPESGVEFTDATKPYVTATTTLLAATGADASGGEPAGNSPVILPALNISYLDVGVGYTSGAPTRAVNLTATPAIDSMALAWEQPVDLGTSPITKYVVTAKRLDTGTTVGPVDVVGTSYTMTGLAGGRAYDFSVVAVNATGASAPTTVMAIPIEKPPPTPVAPPATTPVTTQPPAASTPVAAPVQVGKAVTVKARAVSGKSKIKVDVNPNLGKGYWKFQFEKQVGPNSWKLLSKVYKTQGSAEKLTVNLKKGTYRAVVLPKPGYAVATSAPVTLKR